MALTINSGPVLSGESARAFIAEFERNNLLPTRKLSPEREAELAEVERKSRAFMAYLKKQLHG